MFLKRSFLFIALLLIIITIIFSYYITTNSKYSLDDIKAMLNSTKDSTNFHIQESFFQDNSLIASIDSYKKDNIYYVHQPESDSLYNYENNKNITIIHNEKKIISFSFNEDVEIINPYIDFFSKLQINNIKYKYDGKELVEGKECLKVSLIDEYSSSNNNIVYYYYIDVNNSTLIKAESYKENSSKEMLKMSEVLYTYNTVTDNDILRFDVNNYPDYEFLEN